MRPRHLVLLLLPVLLSGCVTTTRRTTSWGEPSYGEGPRYGHVERVTESVRREEGDPGAGAVAGALIGGLLGSAFGGHTHFDRWGNAYHHGSAAGALAGAVGGAAVGAAASQGRGEERSYEVLVRFDDGGYQSFVFPDYLPFGVGDPVALTARGLERW